MSAPGGYKQKNLFGIIYKFLLKESFIKIKSALAANYA